MQLLRQKVEALEKEYAQLVGPCEPDTSVLLRQHGQSCPSSNASTAQCKLFLEVAKYRDELRRENKELKRAMIEYANFQRRVGQALEDTREEAAEMLQSVTLLPKMKRAECHAISINAHKSIERFEASRDVVSTGVRMFGWRDQRKIEDGMLTFSVKKQFRCHSALKLSLNTWSMLSSPTQLPKLYSSSINMRIKVLQWVDEDNVVMYRTIHRGDGHVHIRSVFLLTRFRTQIGYVILFRSIDRARVRYLIDDGQENEGEWHELFSWTIFEEKNEVETQLHFGGMVPGTAAANAHFWMLEVLLICLRWEAAVVGPLFTLSAAA